MEQLTRHFEMQGNNLKYPQVTFLGAFQLEKTEKEDCRSEWSGFWSVQFQPISKVDLEVL